MLRLGMSAGVAYRLGEGMGHLGAKRPSQSSLFDTKAHQEERGRADKM